MTDTDLPRPSWPGGGEYQAYGLGKQPLDVPRPAGIHTLDERCFYCASNAELETRPVHMDTPPEQCPFWAPDDVTEVTR